MDPENIPALPSGTAKSLLAEYAELLYEETSEGRWLVLAVPKNGAERLVIAEGATREQAEQEADKRAVLIFGGASLLRGIAKAFSGLGERFEGIKVNLEGRSSLTSSPAPADIQAEMESLSWRKYLPAGAKGAMAAWILAVDVESDGSFHWHVYGASGKELMLDGAADTWDDAILAAIENLPPPSGER